MQTKVTRKLKHEEFHDATFTPVLNKRPNDKSGNFGTLTVLMVNGGVHTFDNIPKYKYENLVNTMKYFNRSIRKVYKEQ